jgi:uncharacterized protein (DUF305 family)
MNMHFRPILALVFAIVVLLELGSIGSTFAQASPTRQSAEQICGILQGTPHPSAESSPVAVETDLTTLDFDLIYLDAMIPHHEAAIAMATVLLERTDRQEMKDLATSIIETEQVELAIMSGWRAEWYPDIPQLTEMQLIDAMNIKLSDSPGVGGVAGLEEMGREHTSEDVHAVCASGDDIDITYIDTMIAHHSSAIILSREGVNRAIHQEIKQLSDSVIAAQQFNIDQMLAWREAWFPGTPIPDHHG